MLFRFYCALLISVLFLSFDPWRCFALDDEESQSLSTLSEDADQHRVGSSDSPSWWPAATPDDARARVAKQKTAAELQAKMREMNAEQQREAAQLQAQRLAELRQMEDAERQRLAEAAQRERDQRDAAERQQALMARRQIEERRAEEARRLEERIAAERRAAAERQLAAERYAASQQADLARQAAMEEEARRQQEENRQAEDGMMHWRVKYGSGWHHVSNPEPQETLPTAPQPENVGKPGYGITDTWAAPQNEGGSVNGKPRWSSPTDIKLSAPIEPAGDGSQDVGESSLPPISREPASSPKTSPIYGHGTSSEPGISDTSTQGTGMETFPIEATKAASAAGAAGALSSTASSSGNPEENGEFTPCHKKGGCKKKRWHPKYQWRKKGLMHYNVGAPPAPPVSFAPSSSAPASPAQGEMVGQPAVNPVPSVVPDKVAPPPMASPSVSSSSATRAEEIGASAAAAAVGGGLAAEAEKAPSPAPSEAVAPSEPSSGHKKHHKKHKNKHSAPKTKPPEEAEPAPQPEQTPAAPSPTPAATSEQPHEGAKNPEDWGIVPSAPRVEGGQAAEEGGSAAGKTASGVAVSPQQQKILHDLVQQERTMLYEAKHPRPVPHPKKLKSQVLPTPTIPAVPAVGQTPPPLRVPHTAPKMHRTFGHHADDRIMPKAKRIGSVAVPPQMPAYEPQAPVPAPAAVPAAPQPSAPPSQELTEQRVAPPPAASFAEPEAKPAYTPRRTYTPPEIIAAPAAAGAAAIAEGARHAVKSAPKSVAPPPIPPQNFTPASPSRVSSEVSSAPQGYESSRPSRGGTASYPTENASRTALMGAYHPGAVTGNGQAASGTGTSGGSRHGIFAAGRVMGGNQHSASILDLPGHWEGAVAALTGDSWSVIQTHRDPFFYGEPEDRTPAGQPLCHMVKVDGESTLDFSTSPAHELGGHVWDVDLHNAGLTSRPGVVVPVTMRAPGSRGAPLTLNGVQSSGTLRVGDLNNEAAARIARLFTQSPRVIIATDQGQYNVETSGFGKPNARHAFTYCLAQDLSSDPAFYDAAPEGMKFVHEGGR